MAVGMKYKDLCVYVFVNTHQTKLFSQFTSTSFHHWFPQCCHNETRTSWPRWQQWRLCMDPTCISLMKAPLNTAATKYPVCQQQRSMLRPQYGAIPLGYQLATWWQDSYIGPYIERPNSSFSLELTFIPYIDLPFLPIGPQPIRLSKYIVSDPLRRDPTNITSDQRTHFTAKEV